MSVHFRTLACLARLCPCTHIIIHAWPEVTVGNQVHSSFDPRVGKWGGASEGGFPPKGVVAALQTTPPVGLGGDRGACPRSLLSDVGAGPQV